jgi:hypothetical protein
MSEDGESYAGWAIVELMGHRRLAGQVRQVEQYGSSMLRLDVPGKDGPTATQFYSSAAIYCVTPTTEEIARALAAREQPTPVYQWELGRMLPAPDPVDVEGDDEDLPW